jgi:hypothetical protein
MVWYNNHYECNQCGETWEEEWSCMVDDTCPGCGARDTEPYDSDDLTFQTVEQDGLFVVLQSPDSAEHLPEYFEVAKFPARHLAEWYVSIALDAMEI